MVSTDAVSNQLRRATLFRLLANPAYIAILEILQEGPLPASGIAHFTQLSLLATMRHLAALAACGLISVEESNGLAYYHLRVPRIQPLLHLTDELLQNLEHAGVVSESGTEG
jgi:DNA-binding transcriptional ArsR family regulator